MFALPELAEIFEASATAAKDLTGVYTNGIRPALWLTDAYRYFTDPNRVVNESVAEQVRALRSAGFKQATSQNYKQIIQSLQAPQSIARQPYYRSEQIVPGVLPWSTKTKQTFGSQPLSRPPSRRRKKTRR